MLYVCNMSAAFSRVCFVTSLTYTWTTVLWKLQASMVCIRSNVDVALLKQAASPTSDGHSPDRVPTPMTRVSTIVSSVMVGPSMAIPCAMLCFTSSWLRELSANWARTVAFDRSISSRKKKSASLEHKVPTLPIYVTNLDIQVWKQNERGNCENNLWNTFPSEENYQWYYQTKYMKHSPSW